MRKISFAKLICELDYALIAALVVLGSLLRLVTRLRLRQPKGVLLIRPGGLGDLICLVMAVDALPDAQQITYLIEQRSQIWAEEKHLCSIRYDRDFFPTLWKLAGAYEKIIVTEQLYGAAAIYGWAILGPRSKLYGFQSQRMHGFLDVAVSYNPDGEHETESFYRLLATALNVSADVKPSPRHRRRPSDGSYWIGLAGCGVPSRDLPAPTWAELVPHLLPAKTGQKIRIAFHPDSRTRAQAICDLLDNTELFEGSFAELCEAIAAAELMLCMDGGMAHICAYEGVPVAALFTSGVAKKWFPYSVGSSTVFAGVFSCQPCAVFGTVPPCPHNFVCKNFDASFIQIPVDAAVIPDHRIVTGATRSC